MGPATGLGMRARIVPGRRGSAGSAAWNALLCKCGAPAHGEQENTSDRARAPKQVSSARLMKIAQYHGPRGKRDHVTFIKGVDKSAFATAWDRVYITTLFSFEFRAIAETVDFAADLVQGQTQRIFVGGIAAS